MLSHKQIMWEETWINLSLKMRDMPRYEYKNTSVENEPTIKGTNDILKEKFAKFIKQPEQ